MIGPLITLLLGVIFVKFPWPRSENFKSGVDKLRETNDAERVFVENVMTELQERPWVVLFAWAQIIGGLMIVVGLMWLLFALVT